MRPNTDRGLQTQTLRFIQPVHAAEYDALNGLGYRGAALAGMTAPAVARPENDAGIHQVAHEFFQEEWVPLGLG